MNVVRTFHPVGQGAFYTEVFQFNNGNHYVVVYDCGTESEFDFIEKQISEFKNNYFKYEITQIDLLFISHFHADHVNGLKLLLKDVHVVKTVIPMLDDATIILTRVQNYLRFHFSIAQEADRIIQELYLDGKRTGMFGEVEMVSPNLLDRPHDDREGVTPMVHKGNERKSGSKLYVDKIWEYIPFNSLERADYRVPYFRNELNNLLQGQLSLSDLVKNKLEDVKSLYRRVMGNANDNLYTLVVVSKPVDGIEPKPCPRLSHCIYFGDFDYHLKNKPWDRLKGVIKFEKIGTVQVPHHGAKGNWNLEMGNGDPRHYIISSGSTNNHHHPNYWVLENIWNKGHRTYVVSENSMSERMYEFYIE